MAKRLVVIGGGMAAAKLLEELNVRNAAFEITVIGEESQPSYNRILLSSILSGDKTQADIRLLDDNWYRQRHVTLHTGDRAEAVDLSVNTVVTANGRQIPYDRLVFASGSRARIPDIPGTSADGVMGFRSLADLDVIRGHGNDNGKTGGRAIVIGGGLLGLEAAHGLNVLGMDVSVIHRNGWLMNRQLDREAGNLLRLRLEQRGIRFHLGVSPVSVRQRGCAATGVVLANGAKLDAGLVLFAAGIEPREELARAAGINCDRAIIADRYLQTSADNVFALGECCQIEGRTFGLIAPVYEQAACLADRLCGLPTAGYRHRAAPTLLKVSGIDLFSAGTIDNGDGVSSQYLRNAARGIYRRLMFHGDQLAGAILLGDKSGGIWYDELIRSGAQVNQYRPWIMFGNAFAEAA